MAIRPTSSLTTAFGHEMAAFAYPAAWGTEVVDDLHMVPDQFAVIAVSWESCQPLTHAETVRVDSAARLWRRYREWETSGHDSFLQLAANGATLVLRLSEA